MSLVTKTIETKTSNKKMIIFDVYGTLISTGSGSVDATRKILSLQNDKQIDENEFYAKWKQYHRAHMNESNEFGFKLEDDIFNEDLEKLYIDYDIKRNAKEDIKIMKASLFFRTFYSDVKPILKELKNKYRLVIGSNTDTLPLLANLENDIQLFDGTYTSENLQTYKPSKEFYLKILENENISADECVFVGDSIIDDVQGPQEVGIASILVDRKNKYAVKDNEHIIADFYGLADVLL